MALVEAAVTLVEAELRLTGDGGLQQFCRRLRKKLFQIPDLYADILHISGFSLPVSLWSSYG